jgi:hypothetical protein
VLGRWTDYLIVGAWDRLVAHSLSKGERRAGTDSYEDQDSWERLLHEALLLRGP